MSFSQSLCFGENTLQEIEKGVAIATTPNRSSGIINSDSDIIEESPTNHSSVHSYRERKQLNKSKTFHKKKKVKSRSSGQLSSGSSTSKSSNDISKDTISQFMRSEYDFGDEIMKILPGNTKDTNSSNQNICDKATSHEKPAHNLLTTGNDECYESEMFSQWIVPTVPVSLPKPSTETKANDKHTTWEDSYVFNDLELAQIDEEMELGPENVTYTQNVFSAAKNIENRAEVINVDKSDFIDQDIGSDDDLFTEEMKAECMELSITRNTQMSTSHVHNSDEPNFTLNYSDSTLEDDEQPENARENKVNGVADGRDEYLPSYSLKQYNNIDEWGNDFLQSRNSDSNIANHSLLSHRPSIVNCSRISP